VKNSIKISTQFDFRGHTYTPTLVLDLDTLARKENEIPDYHLLLAQENGIDHYSYEYEVLESSELLFSDATGEASAFVDEGWFDYPGFRQRWQMLQQLKALSDIARRVMGVADLEQQPELQAALLEAYRLGQESEI